MSRFTIPTMANGYLIIASAPLIPLSEIDDILITDTSTRKTPTWAVVLAILLFPIGLLFLFAKKDTSRISGHDLRQGQSHDVVHRLE